MNVKLEKAAVIIEAHKQALLTQPDPTLKGGLRVPLDEGGLSYSASDWTSAWEYGSGEFEMDYAANHHGQQPSKEVVKQIGDYIYVNRLDPMSPPNWERAYDRLVAGGVIQQEAPKQTVQEPQAPKKLTPAEFAKEVAQAMEKVDTRTPAGRKQLAEIRQKYLLMEADPVYDRFIADLESRGVYLTRPEQQQLLEWVQNHNLVLTQRQSLERALRALFPNYLTDEEKAVIAIDRDDGPDTYVTAADLKKALGTASPRVSISSRNVMREYVPEVRPQPDTQTLTQKLTPAEIQEHQRLNDLDTMSTADYKKKWGTDPAVNRR